MTDPVANLRPERLADGGVRLTREQALLSLRVDARGAEVELGSTSVELRATAWGRASALRPMTEAAPQVGPCPPMAPDCTAHLIVERGPGVHEWWVGSSLGLEHGWTFSEAPAGDGPLVVDLAGQGARVVVDADGRGAELRVGEQVVRYGRVLAWDADGRSLPAGLEASAA